METHIVHRYYIGTFCKFFVYLSRELLSEHSQFFRAMFTAFRERDEPEVELRAPVEPRPMAQALRFLYSGTVRLTPRNAQDLLALSGYLQLPRLQRACAEYMRALIDRRNCVALYLYTALAGPHQLRTHAEEFLLANFEKVVAGNAEFVQLSATQLGQLLDSDRLLVQSEDTVFR